MVAQGSFVPNDFQIEQEGFQKVFPFLLPWQTEYCTEIGSYSHNF